MEREPKPLEIEIAGKTYELLGALACATVIYREPEDEIYAHIAVLNEDLGIEARGFNNPNMTHWMAGYKTVREEDCRIHRATVLCDDEIFEEAFGWTPIVMEFPEVTEEIRAAYSDVQSQEIDNEWENFNEH